MNLAEIFHDIPGASIQGDSSVNVSGVTSDSRTVHPGDLFIAMRGANLNGFSFVEQALGLGALAVASDELIQNLKVPTVFFPNARVYLGPLASRIYGRPSTKLTIIGITGTNGKTTTSHLIEAILKEDGRNPGYIGTVGYRWNGLSKDAPRTTPEACDLHRILSHMVAQEVTDVVIECSSHGLALGRVTGLELNIGVFTNLTQDHLDFHKTFDEYLEAKWKLFSEILANSSKSNRVAVVNLDDPTGSLWARKIPQPVVTFSLDPSKGAVTFPLERSMGPDGIRARIYDGSQDLWVESPLVGDYNLSNILAAFSVAKTLGVQGKNIARAIKKLSWIPGRLEKVANEMGIHVFVDYAHTQDALLNVLCSLSPFRKKRILVVFGAGGDRDKLKRPRMLEAVLRFADLTIVTSDNPRNEDPQSIIHDILSGMSKEVSQVSSGELTSNAKGVVCVMVDRQAAIEKALQVSSKDDIVLIAGKGHETYQEVNGVQYPFDDRQVARNWVERKGRGS